MADFNNIGTETLKGAALQSLMKAGNYGSRDHSVLAFSGILVADETFTLGSDVYELNLVATDTGAESTAIVAAADTVITFDTAPTIALLPGDAIRMESEYMLVIAYDVATPKATVLRGAFGSTAAEHSIANSDTYQADAPVTAGNMCVPVASTVQADEKASIAAAVNWWVTGYSPNVGGSTGLVNKATLPVTAAVGLTGDSVTFSLPASASATATAETCTNGTIVNPFTSGVAAASKEFTEFVHVVTSGEATAGVLRWVFPFTVAFAQCQVFDSSSSWAAITDGTTAFSGTELTLTESTAWGAGDVVRVRAYA